MYSQGHRTVVGVLWRSCAFLAAVTACGISKGALLTNFSASYALYQQLSADVADFDVDADIDGVDVLMWQRGLGKSGQFIGPLGDADRNGFINAADFNFWKTQFGGHVTASPSVGFKLYFDPKGIVSGRVTAVLDVPSPLPGQPRLNLGGFTRLVDVDPNYTATAQTIILTPPGRQIMEATVTFSAVDMLNPPAGPATIFGFQAEDNRPELGLSDIHTKFEFRAGDFISIFDPANGQTTTFNNSQLGPQDMTLAAPLVLDVNTLTGAVSMRSSSSVPVDINYYEISSLAGSLNAGGWISLDDGEGSDPPGVGWEEAGGAGATVLAESNFTGTLQLNSGPSQSLGHAFNEVAGFRDLRFFYTTPQGALIPGEINYNTGSPAGSVPEPGCLGLALLGFVGVAARERGTG